VAARLAPNFPLGVAFSSSAAFSKLATLLPATLSISGSFSSETGPLAADLSGKGRALRKQRLSLAAVLSSSALFPPRSRSCFSPKLLGGAVWALILWGCSRAKGRGRRLVRATVGRSGGKIGKKLVKHDLLLFE